MSNATAHKQIVMMRVTLDSFDRWVFEGQQLQQDGPTNPNRNFLQPTGNASRNARTLTLPPQSIEPINFQSNPLATRGKGRTIKRRSERTIISEGERLSKGEDFILFKSGRILLRAASEVLELYWSGRREETIGKALSSRFIKDYELFMEKSHQVQTAHPQNHEGRVLQEDCFFEDVSDWLFLLCHRRGQQCEDLGCWESIDCCLASL